LKRFKTSSSNRRPGRHESPPFINNADGNMNLKLTSQPTPSTYHIASTETPISCPIQMADYIPSVMKGVVLTSPHPHLPNLSTFYNRSPKVGLNFGKIFGFEEGDSGETNSTCSSGMSAPSTRKRPAVAAAPPPTRTRRPLIRSSRHASRSQPVTLPASTSDPAGFNMYLWQCRVDIKWAESGEAASTSALNLASGSLQSRCGGCCCHFPSNFNTEVPSFAGVQFRG